MKKRASEVKLELIRFQSWQLHQKLANNNQAVKTELQPAEERIEQLHSNIGAQRQRFSQSAEAAVAELQESLKMSIKIMALAPQLKTLLMTTQRIMEEVPEDRSTRDQEKKLEELEALKQKNHA